MLDLDMFSKLEDEIKQLARNAEVLSQYVSFPPTRQTLLEVKTMLESASSKLSKVSTPDRKEEREENE